MNCLLKTDLTSAIKHVIRKFSKSFMETKCCSVEKQKNLTAGADYFPHPYKLLLKITF